ncbi:MAG: redoxin domain-containing protein, partial [Bacteroidota bacterium]
HNEGKTPWLSEKRRNQLQKSARIYKKILIGKVAPDITVQKRSGQSISLHDIEAKLTVLFLWRPGCGHCKKASPILKSLYEKYQEQGVELLSLCTHLGESVKECWTYVDENELDDWINAVDPRHRSRFIYLYNAQRTPKIYVLDEDKKILIKDISANQLEGLIQRFLKEAEEAVPNP